MYAWNGVHWADENTQDLEEEKRKDQVEETSPVPPKSGPPSPSSPSEDPEPASTGQELPVIALDDFDPKKDTTLWPPLNPNMPNLSLKKERVKVAGKRGYRQEFVIDYGKQSETEEEMAERRQEIITDRGEKKRGHEATCQLTVTIPFDPKFPSPISCPKRYSKPHEFQDLEPYRPRFLDQGHYSGQGWPELFWLPDYQEGYKATNQGNHQPLTLLTPISNPQPCYLPGYSSEAYYPEFYENFSQEQATWSSEMVPNNNIETRSHDLPILTDLSGVISPTPDELHQQLVDCLGSPVANKETPYGIFQSLGTGSPLNSGQSSVLSVPPLSLSPLAGISPDAEKVEIHVVKNIYKAAAKYQHKERKPEVPTNLSHESEQPTNREKITPHFKNRAQKNYLERCYQRNSRPTAIDFEIMAGKLNLTVKQVRNWFYNRRAKYNKEQMMSGRGRVTMAYSTYSTPY